MHNGVKIISSVKKTFQVLEFLSTHKSTLTTIARSLSFSIGSTQRIVNTLIELRYISKDPVTKVLFLSPKFLTLGSAYLNGLEIREIALPYMKKLNEDIDEVVNLAILLNDEEIIYVERIARTSHVITTNLQIGTKRPIHLSSIGKTILAFLPEAKQEKIINNLSFNEYRSKSFRNKLELEEQLKRIKKLGYYAGESDLVDGLFVLAVPIFTHQKEPVAGINISVPSVSGLTNRIADKKLKKFVIPKLIECGKMISSALGYSHQGLYKLSMRLREI